LEVENKDDRDEVVVEEVEWEETVVGAVVAVVAVVYGETPIILAIIPAMPTDVGVTFSGCPLLTAAVGHAKELTPPPGMYTIKAVVAAVTTK
jgi:hypothetical protein